jgi:hypothetical protein
VLTKRHGTWSAVRLVPGSASPTFGGFSGSEMACSVDQSCTIAGSYFTPAQTTRPYALSEVDGHFTRLVSLRGISRLNLSPAAGNVVTVSCGAKDSCVIVEEFAAMDYDQSFVVQESP